MSPPRIPVSWFVGVRPARVLYAVLKSLAAA